MSTVLLWFPHVNVADLFTALAIWFALSLTFAAGWVAHAQLRDDEYLDRRHLRALKKLNTLPPAAHDFVLGLCSCSYCTSKRTGVK